MDQLIHQVTSSKGNHVEVVDPDATIDAAVARMSSRHVGNVIFSSGCSPSGAIRRLRRSTR